MATSRELRIYPTTLKTPENGVGKLFLSPGQINKHAKVDEIGKLIISENADPGDIIAILISIMARREDKDKRIFNACNYLRLAISELDTRELEIHNYSNSLDEKNLDLTAHHRHMHIIAEKMTNHLYKQQLIYAGPKANYHELIVSQDEMDFINESIFPIDENGKFEQFDYRYRLDLTKVFYGDLVRVTLPIRDSAYRNDGLFVFDGNKLVNLSAQWDEYRSIPPEFEIKDKGPFTPEYWMECSPCIKSIRGKMDTDFDKTKSEEIYDTYFNYPGIVHNCIFFASFEIRKRLATNVIWDGFGYSTADLVSGKYWTVICDDEFLQSESEENKQTFIAQILNKDFAFDTPIGNYYPFNELVAKQKRALEYGYVFCLLPKID